MIRTACFVSFPLMILVAALAKPLIILLLTEKWEPCVILLQILCFSTMWGPMSSLNLNVLQVTGRTDLYFNLELKKKAVSIVIILVSLPFGLNWFCISLVIVQLFCVFVNVKSANKVLPLGIFNQYKDILPSLMLSLVMFIIAYGTTFLFDNSWLKLISGGVLGITIYLGGASLMKFDELEQLLELVKIRNNSN